MLFMLCLQSCYFCLVLQAMHLLFFKSAPLFFSLHVRLSLSKYIDMLQQFGLKLNLHLDNILSSIAACPSAAVCPCLKLQFLRRFTSIKVIWYDLREKTMHLGSSQISWVHRDTWKNLRGSTSKYVSKKILKHC